jgi:hypothetical protein
MNHNPDQPNTSRKNPKAAIFFVLGLIFVFVVIPVGWKFVTGEIGPGRTDTVTVEKKECTGGPVTIEDGEQFTWGKPSDYPKKGTMITVEGYVELPNLTYLNKGTYMVNIRSSLAHDSGSHITMHILEGDCENTMIPLPSNYETEDLFILDNAGEGIEEGDKIRVTAKVIDDGALYRIYVKRIEKMEAPAGDTIVSAGSKKYPGIVFSGRLQLKENINDAVNRQSLVCHRNYFYFCTILPLTEIHKQS